MSSWSSNDSVDRRAVTIGGTDGDRVEVLAGLSAGERVIVVAASGTVRPEHSYRVANGPAKPDTTRCNVARTDF